MKHICPNKKYFSFYVKENPCFPHQVNSFSSTVRKNLPFYTKEKPSLLHQGNPNQNLLEIWGKFNKSPHWLKLHQAIFILYQKNFALIQASFPWTIWSFFPHLSQNLCAHLPWTNIKDALDIIFSLNSPISNLEFWYQLLCNSRSHNINYCDLSLVQAHSHKKENKTSTKDNKI